MQFRESRVRAAGFTLIELIVVLIIIAAVAGLVIPAVAMLGRSTDMAVSADTQASLANNIQEYFVLQKRYPQGLDSLLQVGTVGASSGAPTAVYGPVLDAAGQQVSGMTASSPNLYGLLTMDTLTNGAASGDGIADHNRSLTRGGIDYIFDHQSYDISGATPVGQANANNSGSIRRTLGGTSNAVARLLGSAPGEAAALTTAQKDILKRLVPAEFDATGTYTPETDTHLVAFGIGPNCRLVPTTMMNTPLYPGADGKYYGRYIAIFKVFGSGERAVLIGVTDAYGRTPDYTQQEFNQSLPNGGRQG